MKRAYDVSAADFTKNKNDSSCRFHKKRVEAFVISFENARILHVDGEEVQGMEVHVGGERHRIFDWSVSGNELRISLGQKDVDETGNELPKNMLSENKLTDKKIEVRFAQTPYYQVNLYNESRLPAFPFVLEI